MSNDRRNILLDKNGKITVVSLARGIVKYTAKIIFASF